MPKRVGTEISVLFATYGVVHNSWPINVVLQNIMLCTYDIMVLQQSSILNFTVLNLEPYTVLNVSVLKFTNVCYPSSFS